MSLKESITAIILTASMFLFIIGIFLVIMSPIWLPMLLIFLAVSR